MKSDILMVNTLTQDRVISKSIRDNVTYNQSFQTFNSIYRLLNKSYTYNSFAFLLLLKLAQIGLPQASTPSILLWASVSLVSASASVLWVSASILTDSHEVQLGLGAPLHGFPQAGDVVQLSRVAEFPVEHCSWWEARVCGGITGDQQRVGVTGWIEYFRTMIEL